MDRTKAFPKNTEIEVTLTFANEAAAGPGWRGRTVAGSATLQIPRLERPAAAWRRRTGGGLFSGTVASVTPTAEAVTLREHYSLVELPDGNYRPRDDDPRAGYGGPEIRRLQRAHRRSPW